MAADIFVAMSGSDTTGSGTLAAPFATLAKALGTAAAGDTVVLRGGSYAGGVRVDLPNITIRSQAGEWAVITAPTGIEDIDTVVSFNVDASGGRLQRLELVGGYYYAVKTETTFDWGPPTPQYGASHIVIEDCRIHDTGRDCIKITPDCDDVTIRRCEIYNSGRRDPGNAEGIDNVNGDRMVVQDCFIHDIATNGLYAKGGSNGTVIERNLIKNVGDGGIMVGFYTDAEYFDTGVNPGYYENIDCVVRNNIIVNTEAAGIGLYAALNPRIVGNTLVNVAQSSQAALLLNTTQIYFGEDPNPLRVPCRDVLIVDNIVTQSAGTSRPMVQIRLDQDGTVPMDGLTGTLTIGNNRFFREGGPAEFVDDRTGRDYDGDLAGWSALIGSVAGSEGSPGLDANLHLGPGSPCIDAGRAIAGLTEDYDGNPRSASPDIGADEAGAGPALQVPPPAGTIGTRGTTIEMPPPPGPVAGPLTVKGFVAPAAGSYGAGRRVRFTVTLSESAQVLGAPQLEVLVGPARRTATYVSGSGSPQITFEYVVRWQDNATSVAVGQKLIFTSTSAIVAGTRKLAAALPAGIAGAVAAGVRFDTRAPSVVGHVGVPANGIYSTGQALDFVVRFSEVVFVKGTPHIALSGLGASRRATYVSGSGTQALTFRYVVQAGDAVRSIRGLSLARSITLPAGAAISDEAGNRATVTIVTPTMKGIRLKTV